MKHNYHTHTYRCNHASGKDREYVEAAVAIGLETIGFSDHSPYLFPEEAGDYYSGFRMRPELLEDYVGSIESLKKEFEGKIRIYTGVEIEYFPKIFDKTDKFLRDGGVQYMILGQHIYGNEYEAGSYAVAGHKSRPPEELEEYTTNVVNAIKTGKFLYVAHPDVFYFDGPEDFYKEQAKRICDASKETNVPIEINLLGFRGRRHYPNRKFWEVAGEVGSPVVFGIDAHNPAQIYDADAAIKAFREEYLGIELNIIDEELIG